MSSIPELAPILETRTREHFITNGTKLFECDCGDVYFDSPIIYFVIRKLSVSKDERKSMFDAVATIYRRFDDEKCWFAQIYDVTEFARGDVIKDVKFVHAYGQHLRGVAEELTRQCVSTAIIVKNDAVRSLLSAGLRLYSQRKPTKMKKSLEHALHWLAYQIEKHEEAQALARQTQRDKSN